MGRPSGAQSPDSELSSVDLAPTPIRDKSKCSSINGQHFVFSIRSRLGFIFYADDDSDCNIGQATGNNPTIAISTPTTSLNPLAGVTLGPGAPNLILTSPSPTEPNKPSPTSPTGASPLFSNSNSNSNVSTGAGGRSASQREHVLTHSSSITQNCARAGSNRSQRALSPTASQGVHAIALQWAHAVKQALAAIQMRNASVTLTAAGLANEGSSETGSVPNLTSIATRQASYASRGPHNDSIAEEPEKPASTHDSRSMHECDPYDLFCTSIDLDAFTHKTIN